MTKHATFKVPAPTQRLLQVFAFDPSLNLSLETAVINRLTLRIPWEEVGSGPTGEYLEVIDIDPASGFFYPPIDLNDQYLLVQDGLAPSEGTPQFHQQMVYAVASRTIQYFEQALGRKILWSSAITKTGEPVYIPRLRIYPHALREANAYYSPDKRAVLFGYFPASTTDPGLNLPGGMVFTCLSYDIIAHEMTHAVLDGLHPYFTQPSNIDVIALHEAFADIIALFQHFSHSDVLRDQIARTRGDLSSENLLAELAQQFGQAIGNRGALRSALGKIDPASGVWTRIAADPRRLERTREPHERGAILLAAVFDAFLALYKHHTQDLLRLATGGSGILLGGAIHPDLVGRLADEAAKISGRMVNICIRALDYCPPIDISFGEYLRALITADYELVPNDRDGYRIAVIEAFRRHGIYPADVRSLSEESLLWRPPEHEDAFAKFFADDNRLRSIQRMRGPTNRVEIFNDLSANIQTIQGWISGKALVQTLADALKLDNEATVRTIEKDLRLKLWPDKEVLSVVRDPDGRPSVEVHSVRSAYRIGPSGQTIADLVIEITQQRYGYLDRSKQKKVDAGEISPPPEPDFIFRGGTTLLIDMENGKVRYAIGKNVISERRLEIQRRFFEAKETSLAATYFGDARLNYTKGGNLAREPFSLLHRGDQVKEEF